LRGPKGTRNREAPAREAVTSFTKERTVTNRVPFGELVSVAEFPPTQGLTENAESESSRRLVFSASLARTCEWRSARESSLPFARERSLNGHWPTLAHKLSRSLHWRGHWVNDKRFTGVERSEHARNCVLTKPEAAADRLWAFHRPGEVARRAAGGGAAVGEVIRCSYADVGPVPRGPSAVQSLPDGAVFSCCARSVRVVGR